jgi:hypothetical protein
MSGSFARMYPTPCLVLAVLLAVAAPAWALPIVQVSATATASVIGNTPAQDTSSVSGTTQAATSADAVLTAPITAASNFLVGGAASGSAEPGILGASAAADLQSTHTGTLTFFADNLAGGSALATAEFTIDDLVVRPTAGGGAATVAISLRLDLSGSLSASGSFNTPPEFSWPVGAGGTASVTVDVTATAIGTSAFSGTRLYAEDAYGAVSSSSTGLLEAGDALATPVFDVEVGVPFVLHVKLGVLAGVSTNITHGNADAAASFGQALQFATGRPVFALPDGYTVDAPSAGIVDNVFVPEPSTLALTVLGAGILACLRRATSFDRGARRA